MKSLKKCYSYLRQLVRCFAVGIERKCDAHILVDIPLRNLICFVFQFSVLTE